MKALLTFVLVLAVFLSFEGTSAAQAESGDPVELAEALQRKYDRVHDFSADFVHSYTGGVLGRKTTERGTVYIKKPGQMRWEYDTPEKKLFISDGVKVYSYLPADRQVIVGTMPSHDEASTPILFLLGKGEITRDFTVRHGQLDDVPADSFVLELTPKRAEREYESLVLVIDRDTLQIRQLASTDRQGGTSAFTFSNLQENRGLPDKLFRFTIPRGVDVITDAHDSPR